MAGSDNGPSPRRESERSTTAMHGRGKSDMPIVPAKPSNKGGVALPAERVEGRGLAKENGKCEGCASQPVQ